MLTIVLPSNQRGLLVRDGVPVRYLECGRTFVWTAASRLSVVAYDLDEAVTKLSPELAQLAPPGAIEPLDVPARHVAIVSVDGVPKRALVPGRWALWQPRARVTAKLVSLEPLFLELPPEELALVPAASVSMVVVAPYERVLVLENGALASVLAEGRYVLSRDGRELRLPVVDLRERELPIVGQEVMTADKVSLRLSVLVALRVVDPVRSVTSVADLSAAIYSTAQLAARRLIAGLSLDQLLERRNDAASLLRDEVAAVASTWGVEVLRVDLKDVVLPGEMRTILNRVIEAEKAAAASVIQRREETAATRSLANTAKLLENNPTLLRLKEMEAWKEIAERVGQITIVASPKELMSTMAIGPRAGDR